MKTLSLVIPIYNEFEILGELAQRLDTLVANQPGYRWEVILVNDGSRDGSSGLLTTLATRYSWLTAIHFSRNFGHQAAISAGLDHASGDAVVILDGDLQDPPELIPEMAALWQQDGFDVVYATRNSREGETWFKRLTAKAFYRLLGRLSDTEIPMDTGDFRLMSRPVVDALLSMPERNRFLRGMVSWVGFKQTAFHYERAARTQGETKFSFLKMLRFATDGLISFSKVPLQWITTAGFVISGISFLGVLVVLYQTLFAHITLPGWSSLMIGILMIGGIQLICLGMIGEYVGRIFDEVRQRPMYCIQRIDQFKGGEREDWTTKQSFRLETT